MSHRGCPRSVLEVVNPLKVSNQKKPGEHLMDARECSAGSQQLWTAGYRVVGGAGVLGTGVQGGGCTGYLGTGCPCIPILVSLYPYTGLIASILAS